jgi:hypothetical protein
VGPTFQRVSVSVKTLENQSSQSAQTLSSAQESTLTQILREGYDFISQTPLPTISLVKLPTVNFKNNPISIKSSSLSSLHPFPSPPPIFY